MKIIGVCLFFLLSVIRVNSQTYGFKKDWTPAPDVSKATYIMYLTKEDDTTYLCKYYNKYGVALNYETYKDSSLNIPNGLFTWYNSKGFIDSVGYVVNKVKDKFWYYKFNAEFQPQRIEEYDHGRLVNKSDSFDLKRMYHYANTKPDSKQNISEPEFPGGANKWKQFLQENLMPPQPMWGTKANLNTGDVVIDLVIDTLGKISILFPLQSLDIQSDLEAMRVIKLSSVWTPGKLNGIPVIFNHTQRIHFGQ
jgi:protein TonB